MKVGLVVCIITLLVATPCFAATTFLTCNVSGAVNYTDGTKEQLREGTISVEITTINKHLFISIGGAPDYSTSASTKFSAADDAQYENRSDENTYHLINTRGVRTEAPIRSSVAIILNRMTGVIEVNSIFLTKEMGLKKYFSGECQKQQKKRF